MQQRDRASALLDRPIDEDCLDVSREIGILILETEVQVPLSVSRESGNLAIQEVDLGMDLLPADIVHLADPAQRYFIDKAFQDCGRIAGLFVAPGR